MYCFIRLAKRNNNVTGIEIYLFNIEVGEENVNLGMI